MYLVIRLVHVLFGALWVGMALSSAVYLMPILDILGFDAGRVMGKMRNRAWIIPVIATLTVLSGVWLFWSRGYMGPAAGSHPGMLFGSGAITGIAAYIIGAGVISRSLARATALGAELERAQPPDRAALAATIAALRRRATTAGKLVAVLLILTTILMVLGVTLL